MSQLPTGKITISRPTGGDIEEIVLSFTDEISGCQFLEFHIALDEFSKALTGLGYRPGTMELRFLDKIGMQRENKTEKIPYVAPPNYKERTQHAREVLAEYEVEGWKAYDADYMNHHRWFREKSGKEFVTVRFSRHVEVKP